MRYVQTPTLGLLVAALMVMGCTQKNENKPTTKNQGASTQVGSKAEDAPHSHGHGPNGGVMFDLGKYHAEFTVDHGKKECMIVVIGSDEKTPTPVAATELTLTIKETKTKDGKDVPAMTIALMPKDATDGKASEFVGTDDGLGNVADFEGTVSGEIDGKPSQGEFKE